MNIRFSNLIAALIPAQKLRRRVRSYYADDRGKNNKIFLVSPDGVARRVRHIPGMKIRFDGDDNTLTVHLPLGNTDVDIKVSNNVNITLFPYSKLKLSVLRGHTDRTPANITIGRGMFSSGKIDIDLCNGGGDITIGDNCMISWGVTIRTGDYHTIIEKDTHKVINMNKSVHIGNRVWIGSKVTILKGTVIPDNCIVGANATVAKKFTDTNCAIAGNPAKVVKTGIDWNFSAPTDYARAHPESNPDK